MLRLPALLLLLSTTTAPAPAQTTSSPPSSRGHFDAWLWQRQQTPAVTASAVRFAELSDGRLHVMVVDGPFTRGVGALAQTLAATGQPVVLTFRLPTLPPADDGRVQTVVQAWQAAGVAVVAVEIDHDCPTRGLPAYAEWLRSLRHHTPPSVKVDITALPTWLDDPAHAAVFAAVDDVTLQVHAIAAPRLLDVDAARRAIARAPGLRVALPTYAVDLARGPPLHATVADVASVRATAPRVAWFRWPVDGDVTAWSVTTLLLVEAAPGLVAPSVPLLLRLVPIVDDAGQPTPGVRLIVENPNAHDVPLCTVRVEGAASVDAVVGTRSAPVVGGTLLSPVVARFLPPQASVAIGWAVSSAPGALHVSCVDDAPAIPADGPGLVGVGVAVPP